MRRRHMWPTLHWTHVLDMFNAILNAAGSPSWFLLKLKTELRPPSLYCAADALVLSQSQSLPLALLLLLLMSDEAEAADAIGTKC